MLSNNVSQKKSWIVEIEDATLNRFDYVATGDPT